MNEFFVEDPLANQTIIRFGATCTHTHTCTYTHTHMHTYIHAQTHTHTTHTSTHTTTNNFREQPTFQKYHVRVIAWNEEGAALAEPDWVYGYSGESS